MKDQTFEAPARIAEILADSGRIRFVLAETYGVAVDAVTSLRLDGDNFKIDIWAAERMIRFKAKGTDRILATQPGGGMAMQYDPALAQAIFRLVDDYVG